MRRFIWALTILALASFASVSAGMAQPTLGGGGTPGGGTPGGGGNTVYGAIAFTSDGSYATAWKRATQADAEAHVAKECAAFGRGACKTIGFPGDYCVALVHFRSRRWRISFPGGGNTYPSAQQDAMKRCGEDRRTRASRCTLRVVVCGDGR